MVSKLATQSEDHAAVGLDVQWEWKSKHGVKAYKQVDWMEVGKPENAPKVRELIDGIPQCAWNVDIHDHMQFVQKQCDSRSCTRVPPEERSRHARPTSRKQPWTLRRNKLWMRSILRHYRKYIDDTHRLRYANGQTTSWWRSTAMDGNNSPCPCGEDDRGRAKRGSQEDEMAVAQGSRCLCGDGSNTRMTSEMPKPSMSTRRWIG